ncbi:MAG: hypothetical protein E5V64_06040 [Mesorhizobium sp.]|uniref:hypothetical protein n=1 Tax=Mesorhizobium sp. TaxID=1871066 RepID=UPI0011F6F7A6|nr:hypothetical protein [Mesorhizobium sp.]TIV83896.1 MAG: hypothetical protein E5V64_06040 [Mesorhizobium sp.]
MGMEGLDEVLAELLEEWARRARRWLIVAGILIVLCLAMIVALSIRPARSAQLSCGPLPVLLKQLVDRYHEFVVMTANNADGGQVLVTLSDAGTFTVLLGDGKACVILAGDKAELNNGI